MNQFLIILLLTIIGLSSNAQNNDFAFGIQCYNKQNYEQAFHHFLKAQMQGIDEASNYLGICYENGYGVDVNIPKAIENYEMGINKGDAYAMVNLGCLYGKGLNGVKDEEKAFSLFKQSAEKGCNYGQYLLAYSFFYGIGTPKDRDMAIYWMTKAKDNNAELAKNMLKYIVEYEKENNGKLKEEITKPSIVTIIMKRNNQVFYVPCIINGQKADFVFDTGAAMISLSKGFLEKLISQGRISQKDVLGKVNTKVADGRIQTSTLVNIKDVEIGGMHLYNVKATIKTQQDAPLLLGLTAIEKLGKVTISGNQLIIIRK